MRSPIVKSQTDFEKNTRRNGSAAVFIVRGVQKMEKRKHTFLGLGINNIHAKNHSNRLRDLAIIVEEI